MIEYCPICNHKMKNNQCDNCGIAIMNEEKYIHFYDEKTNFEIERLQAENQKLYREM